MVEHEKTGSRAAPPMSIGSRRYLDLAVEENAADVRAVVHFFHSPDISSSTRKPVVEQLLSGNDGLHKGLESIESLRKLRCHSRHLG